MEAIMIPNMKLRLQPRVIPNQWQDLDGVWADQDTYGVATQILLESGQLLHRYLDRPILHLDPATG